MSKSAIAALATVGALLALDAPANATSFTMTTEAEDSFGFIDTDTIQMDGEIGKVLSYTVMSCKRSSEVTFFE